jgi:hypothetical protein
MGFEPEKLFIGVIDLFSTRSGNREERGGMAAGESSTSVAGTGEAKQKASHTKTGQLLERAARLLETVGSPTLSSR